MIKPTSLAYIFLAAALAACDAPASSATAQALTDTTVLPATGWGDSGVTWTSSSDGSVSWCCTNWYVPLPLGVGESVGSISTTVRDNGTANGFGTSSNNVIVVLLSQTSSGSTVLGSVSTDGSGNLQSKTLTLSSPHTVASGESLVVKAVALAGGAFPGPASHPSLIEAITIPPTACTRVTHMRKLVPFVGQSIGTGVFQTQTANFAGIWQPIAEGDFLGVSLPVEAGERMDSVTVLVFGSVGWTVRTEIFAMTGTDSLPESLGTFESALIANDQSGTIPLAENVDEGRRAYWVQFVGHSVTGSGFKPRVGPIALHTSGPGPGCPN